MAQEVQEFMVTVTAGTAIASPQVTQLALGIRIVDRIEVRIPPGPRGEVGFWLGSAGVQIIPKNLGTFIVANDEELGWDLQDFMTSGAWEVHIYNTGTYNHTLQFRFLLRYTAAGATAATAQPIAASDLSPVSTQPPAGLPSLPSLPPLPGP